MEDFLLAERTFEDHENLVEPLLAWTRDSENKVLFQERGEKFEVFKNPQVGPVTASTQASFTSLNIAAYTLSDQSWDISTVQSLGPSLHKSISTLFMLRAKWLLFIVELWRYLSSVQADPSHCNISDKTASGQRQTARSWHVCCYNRTLYNLRVFNGFGLLAETNSLGLKGKSDMLVLKCSIIYSNKRQYVSIHFNFWQELPNRFSLWASACDENKRLGGYESIPVTK